MKVLNKILAFTLVLILSIVSGFVIFKSNYLETVGKNTNRPVIILDAGHGGLTNTID